MIYCDNAATGGFKPRAVTDATQTVTRYLSANPLRSGHRLALAGAEIVYNCRKAFAEIFSVIPQKPPSKPKILRPHNPVAPPCLPLRGRWHASA